MDSQHGHRRDQSSLAARLRFTATVVVPLLVVTGTYVFLREYDPSATDHPAGAVHAHGYEPASTGTPPETHSRTPTETQDAPARNGERTGSPSPGPDGADRPGPPSPDPGPTGSPRPPRAPSGDDHLSRTSSPHPAPLPTGRYTHTPTPTPTGSPEPSPTLSTWRAQIVSE